MANAVSPTDQLISAYQATARAADNVDVVEKSIIINTLVTSGRAAANRLRTRVPNSEADARQLDTFTTAIQGEDYIARGLSVANTYRTQIQSFLVWVGTFLGAVIVGLFALLNGSATATGVSATPFSPLGSFVPGFSFRQAPIPNSTTIHLFAAYGPHLLALLAGWAATIIAWWNGKLKRLAATGTLARVILRNNLDVAERTFFEATGGKPPLRTTAALVSPVAVAAWIGGSCVAGILLIGAFTGVLKF